MITPPPGHSSLFQHYLAECQLYLEAVPTMFRLELLENIFSLLFLSHSDFSEPNHCSMESKQNSSNEETLKEENSEREESHSSVKSGQKTLSCRGFLLDTGAMEGVLRLIREGLEGMCALGRALEAEADLTVSLGCSVTVETFSFRLQRLSKHTAEAHWRLQIIITNQKNANSESPKVIYIADTLRNTCMHSLLLLFLYNMMVQQKSHDAQVVIWTTLCCVNHQFI